MIDDESDNEEDDADDSWRATTTRTTIAISHSARLVRWQTSRGSVPRPDVNKSEVGQTPADTNS